MKQVLHVPEKAFTVWFSPPFFLLFHNSAFILFSLLFSPWWLWPHSLQSLVCHSQRCPSLHKSHPIALKFDASSTKIQPNCRTSSQDPDLEAFRYFDFSFCCILRSRSLVVIVVVCCLEEKKNEKEMRERKGEGRLRLLFFFSEVEIWFNFLRFIYVLMLNSVHPAIGKKWNTVVPRRHTVVTAPMG